MKEMNRILSVILPQGVTSRVVPSRAGRVATCFRQKAVSLSVILLPLLFLITGCEKEESNETIIRIYGDALTDIAYSIANDGSDIFIAGERRVVVRSSGNVIDEANSKVRMGLIRADKAGTEKWQITPGTGNRAVATKLLVLSDGSLVAAGTITTASGAGEYTNIYVVKASPTGTILWESIAGGEGNQSAAAIVERADGGFMIAGTTDTYRPGSGSFSENLAGMKDLYVLQLSSTGDSIASYAYGYGGDDMCVDIKRDIAGGYVLLGTTDNKEAPGLDNNSMLLIRINEDGSNRGAAIIGDTSDQYAAGLEVLPGGYMLAATVGRQDENRSIQIVRLSSNIQSAPVINTTLNLSNVSSAVNTITAANGYFYLGGSSGAPTTSNALIIKIDQNGEIVKPPFISGGTGSQEIFGLVATDDGYLYACGRTSYENNSMMLLIRTGQ